MSKNSFKEILSNLKVGDFVQTELHGAGVVSEGDTKEVFHIDKAKRMFWVEEWDETYRKDSVYAYSLDTGRTVNNYMPGFFQQVISIK